MKELKESKEEQEAREVWKELFHANNHYDADNTDWVYIGDKQWVSRDGDYSCED